MAELTRYHDAVTNIRATGRSAYGWITVTREPDGDINVRVHQGMLYQLTDDEIAAEIRTALLDALADHRRQYIDVRVQHFGSAVGVSAFVPPEIEPQPQPQPQPRPVSAPPEEWR